MAVKWSSFNACRRRLEAFWRLKQWFLRRRSPRLSSMTSSSSSVKTNTEEIWALHEEDGRSARMASLDICQPMEQVSGMYSLLENSYKHFRVYRSLSKWYASHCVCAFYRWSRCRSSMTPSTALMWDSWLLTKPPGGSWRLLEVHESQPKAPGPN